MLTFSFVTVLLLLSGFFSGTETAYTSLSPVQVKNLSDPNRGKKGKRIAYLTSNLEALISTILVVNNIINTLISTLTTLATISIFSEAWVGIASVALVILILIFGEISPKQLALTYNEFVVWWSADILYFLLPIFKPFVVLVTAFSNLISSLFKGTKRKALTLETILQITSIAENMGILQREEKSVFQSLIRSGNMPISSILTHRKDIISFENTAPMEEIYPTMLQAPFDIFPIWEGNPENITGILSLHDVMRRIAEGKNLKDLSVKNLCENPTFVPASKKVKELFRIFATNERNMLVVLDEFGGLSGILTKDNLLREILGELYHQEENPEINIHQKSANLYEIKGEAPIYDFEEFFDLKLKTGAQTVGGYLIEKVDRIPQENEVVNTDRGKFIIQKIENNRIALIFFIPFNLENTHSNFRTPLDF